MTNTTREGSDISLFSIDLEWLETITEIGANWGKNSKDSSFIRGTDTKEILSMKKDGKCKETLRRRREGTASLMN